MKTISPKLSKIETRFIFKAIAFATADARVPQNEKDLMHKIAAGLYAQYVKTFGEPTPEDLGIGKHQPHCRASLGFVCSCVKTDTIEEAL